MTFVSAVLNHVPGSVAARLRSGSRSARVLRPLVNRLVPERQLAIEVRSGPGTGLIVIIEPRREKMFWTGTHEVAVQKVVSELCRPGGCFWDIGAHIGFMSLIASRLVGHSGAVIAFEPLEANRRRFAQAVDANHLENVTIFPAAVAAEDGSQDLHEGAGSTTWSLHARGPGAATRLVECRAIDSLVADGVRAPDAIKVDVEGAEVDVLRGARRLIADRRPPMIVEFHDPSTLSEARKLLPTHEFQQLEATQWLLR